MGALFGCGPSAVRSVRTDRTQHTALLLQSLAQGTVLRRATVVCLQEKTTIEYLCGLDFQTGPKRSPEATLKVYLWGGPWGLGHPWACRPIATDYVPPASRWGRSQSDII